MLITKRCTFSASHRLGRPGKGDTENLREFGKCANPYGHGHNYILEVTLEGETTPERGYFLNFDRLGEIIEKEVIGLLDHKCLHEEIPFFRDHPATCENIAFFIWKNLKGKFRECHLFRILLKETENNFVEYYG